MLFSINHGDTENSFIWFLRVSVPPWLISYEDLQMVATAPCASIRSQKFDVADWSQIEPLCTDLLDRPIASPAELEKWLLDFSELDSRDRRIRQPPVHRQKLPHRRRGDREGVPALRRRTSSRRSSRSSSQLQKKFLESPHRAALTDQRYAILDSQMAGGRRNLSATKTCRWRRRSPSSSPSTTRSAAR